MGGAGVALLIVGAITGGLVVRDKSIYGDSCTAACSDGRKAAGNEGRALGPVTTVALVVGAAGLAGGGIWLGLRGSSQPKAPLAARLGVGPIAGGAAWRMEGSW